MTLLNPIEAAWHKMLEGGGLMTGNAEEFLAHAAANIRAAIEAGSGYPPETMDDLNRVLAILERLRGGHDGAAS
jgi:hypothetical protein